eukprot:CAMPEP_0118974068 /NCGR_PEP_ID=MMETSP1173-20130426/11056_1 /TAXON_ID=1034831 /ORGANISM="Rhizochromulina marina cf, Strain CCMP1243" /LENGTH=339 /DNA_ID=CAMNT_0006923771 /DNA_START=64 /DNA_END=1083 /DNA_ORIENTATION=-
MTARAMEARRVVFSLSSSLGMELTEKAVVVRPVPGGQAERAGVRPGWRLVGMQGQKLKSSQHLQDLLAHYKELNVSEAALTFLPEELPRPKPRQPAKAPVKAPRTPPSSVPPPRAGGGVDALDVASWTPKMKQGVAAAGCWFIVKFLFGPVVHQWLSTVLAFGFCAVVTSTVGFDPTMFFGGLATLIMVLRLLGFFLGQGVHDCIVLGLIAAYNTKPSSASFDGRPMREMQAAQAEIRQHQEAAARSVHRSEPQNFLEKILAKGREVVQDVVADVADANISIDFYDYHFFLVAEAKVSKKRMENVFYIGAFQRWFNLNTQFAQWALALEAQRQTRMMGE